MESISLQVWGRLRGLLYACCIATKTGPPSCAVNHPIVAQEKIICTPARPNLGTHVAIIKLSTVDPSMTKTCHELRFHCLGSRPVLSAVHSFTRRCRI